MKPVKLSAAMIEMIKGAAIHEVRITDDVAGIRTGDIVKVGYMVAGRSGTIVALMDRKLVTASTAEFYGINWLTPAGVKILSELIGPSEMPDLGDDIASEDHPTESDMITDAREADAQWRDVEAGEAYDARGDAEKTFDAENIEAERRDLEADELREIMAEREESQDAWHDDNAHPFRADLTDTDVVDLLVSSLTGDRLVVPTSGPHQTFVTVGYLNTMSRIAEHTKARRAAWLDMQAAMISNFDHPDGFAFMDRAVIEGSTTFRQAEKRKRILRQVIRPTLGTKRKPSKTR